MNESTTINNRLEAMHLAKSYGKKSVVTDISLTVSSGEVVGLLGPNGAGKTTSFYMITGLVRADNGTIRLNEDDITASPIHERAKAGIGYLPQDASIFRKLSVRDNIYAVLEIQKHLTSKQRNDICENLLDEFHIQHIKDSIGQALSGGERRRVEIARALAIEPKFILLDEPFAGVDPLSVKDIQNIIRHLKHRQIGVLITDHNVRETLGVCDRAYILFDGKLLIEGEPAIILANEEVKRVYLGEDFK